MWHPPGKILPHSFQCEDKYAASYATATCTGSVEALRNRAVPQLHPCVLTSLERQRESWMQTQRGGRVMRL